MTAPATTGPSAMTPRATLFPIGPPPLLPLVGLELLSSVVVGELPPLPPSPKPPKPVGEEVAPPPKPVVRVLPQPPSLHFSPSGQQPPNSSQ